MKTKAAIYISSIGIILSVVVIIFQALTPSSMITGIVILLSNIAILLINLSIYKKEQEDSKS